MSQWSAAMIIQRYAARPWNTISPVPARLMCARTAAAACRKSFGPDRTRTAFARTETCGSTMRRRCLSREQ
eukprot:639417-Prymnesium_polylepis.1